MTKYGIDCRHLPVSAIGSLITTPLGRLAPVLTPGDRALPYTALDHFDQSLRRSGLLLLETDTTLELVGNTGRPISQMMKHTAGFITDLPKGPLKQTLAGFSPLRRLLPAGSGELQHAVLAFTDDQDKTHCRAYLLFLTAQENRSAALVMLQPIKGYGASLKLLRERVQELGGSAFSADALYDQLFPTRHAYDARPDITFARDATAFDVANRIISAHIPIARANEHGIIADLDTEFLHDYRIQLRKIRSVLSLFRGIHGDALASDLKGRFAALMAPTGALRDLDVYLRDKQNYYNLVPKSLHDGLDAMYDMFAKQRAAEQAKLSRHLRSKRYRQEITELAAYFANADQLERGPNAHLPAHDYACSLIWNRYRKVCGIASGIHDQTPDADVHALRIQCKKLRYLMEFFGGVFPTSAFKSLLTPLKKLQDNLGLFNDYSVQQENLRAALLKLQGEHKVPDLEIAQSVGALIAVLHARQLDERAKVVKNFARFNSPRTQQTFRALFKEGNGQP